VPEPAGSQSLERGLAILSSFQSSQPLLGVSDLSRVVGLSRSTTHRYVSTLAALGYLQQDADTRKYRLGPRVLDLGFSAINSMELRHICAPHLASIATISGWRHRQVCRSLAFVRAPSYWRRKDCSPDARRAFIPFTRKISGLPSRLLPSPRAMTS
jgi:hypothetical protein